MTYNPICSQCIDCKAAIKKASTRCLQCNKVYMKKTFYTCSKFIPCSTITSWRVSAEYRDISWNLTPKQLDRLFKKQNGLCALTGTPLTNIRNDPHRISLDRIDSSKSYTVNNVQFVTTQVNLCKQEYSIDDFIMLCKQIVDYRMSKLEK